MSPQHGEPGFGMPEHVADVLQDMLRARLHLLLWCIVEKNCSYRPIWLENLLQCIVLQTISEIGVVVNCQDAVHCFWHVQGLSGKEFIGK